jgi:DNA polymerase-3 subunit beta
VVAAVSNYQAKGDGKRGVIVPHKVATELQRHLDEAGTVKVQLGERQVAFDNGRLLYVSNVIEGQYPQYNMVVPKDFAYAVKAPRETLALDIKRASVVQDKQESRVVLAFEKNRLNVSSFATEVGAYDSFLDIEFSQDPIKVCFNYHYLNDMLKTIGGDEVVFHMNKPATPVVLRTPGHPDNTYLLMPIKLTEYSMDEPAGGAAGGASDDDAEDADDEDEDGEYADDEAETEESYQ